jgi:hypothetical protein
MICNVFFCEKVQGNLFEISYHKYKQKLWSSGRTLGSKSEGCGFDPCPMLDGSDVRVMPGLISAPNSGSL